MARKPCLGYRECGQFVTRGSWCPAHARAAKQRANARRNETSIYHGPEHRRFRRLVIARDRCCQVCTAVHGLHAHHIVKPQDGGSWEPENGIALCGRCHGAYEGALRRGDLAAEIVLRVHQAIRRRR